MSCCFGPQMSPAGYRREKTPKYSVRGLKKKKAHMLHRYKRDRWHRQKANGEPENRLITSPSLFLPTAEECQLQFNLEGSTHSNAVTAGEGWSIRSFTKFLIAKWPNFYVATHNIGKNRKPSLITLFALETATDQVDIMDEGQRGVEECGEQ